MRSAVLAAAACLLLCGSAAAQSPDASADLSDSGIVWRETLRPTEAFSQVLLKFLVTPTAPLSLSCGGRTLATLQPPSPLPVDASEDTPVPWHVLSLPEEVPAYTVCEASSLSDFEFADARFSKWAGGLEQVAWYDDYDARPRFLPRFQTREDDACDRGMCLGLKGKKQSGEQEYSVDEPSNVLRFRVAPRGGFVEVVAGLADDQGELRFRMSDGGADAHWIKGGATRSEIPGTRDLAQSLQGSQWRSVELRLTDTVSWSVDGEEAFAGRWPDGLQRKFTSVSFAADRTSGGDPLFDDFVAGPAELAAVAPEPAEPAAQPETDYRTHVDYEAARGRRHPYVDAWRQRRSRAARARRWGAMRHMHPMHRFFAHDDEW